MWHLCESLTVLFIYSNKGRVILKVSTMTSSETCQVTTADNRSEVADYLEMMLGPVQMDDHLTLVIITLFYTTVLVTGILGNISVCLVIFRSSHLHTAMNYYLVSLAFADLMIIILGENLHLFTLLRMRGIQHPKWPLFLHKALKTLSTRSVILPLRRPEWPLFSIFFPQPSGPNLVGEAKKRYKEYNFILSNLSPFWLKRRNI